MAARPGPHRRVGASAIIGAVDFTCPRCRAAVSERFYGPCGACRDVLRATLGGEGGEVVVEAYEPKMNVVPNQVATKD